MPPLSKVRQSPGDARAQGPIGGAVLGLACWCLTGAVMFLGFSFGLQFVVHTYNAAPPNAGFLGAIALYDGSWYKQVAQEGYHYERHAESNVAFFPAYPLLGRWVAAVTGLGIEAALLAVSNASLLGAFLLLNRYLRARPIAMGPAAMAPAGAGPAEPRSAMADYTLVALGLFPAGCFFRMCYTESTFLLLAILAMHGISRRWPPAAVALVAGLATATRATGVALLAPIALYVWQGQATRAARAWRLAIWLPLACWGLIAFMIFQYAAFGDAVAFARAHANWRIRPALGWLEKTGALATLEPLRAVYDPASPAYWNRLGGHGAPWFSLDFANPLYFVSAIALVALGARRRWLTLGETLWSALMLLIPYLTRAYEMGMTSAGRFVAVVFPVFIVLGHLLARLPPALATTILAVSAFFLAAYSALFAAGFFIL